MKKVVTFLRMTTNQPKLGETVKINLGQSRSVEGTISEITTNKWGTWVEFITIYGDKEFFKHADFLERILS